MMSISFHAVRPEPVEGAWNEQNHAAAQRLPLGFGRGRKL